MKVAFVHELLTMRGGAENVLRILADMFPEAPIYTLLYDEKKLGDWFPAKRVRKSALQNSPLFKIYSLFSILPLSPLGYGRAGNSQFPFNHHLYLRHFPKAVEAWDFSAFDLVISTSSAFVHGIITNGKPKHLCIVNSPARYLWDRTHDVLEQAQKGPLGFLKKKYLEHVFHTLRIWDSEAADRPDSLLAASKTVERRIQLYWRRESEVLYPPIDDFWFNNKIQNGTKEVGGGNYLLVSSLVRYKRIDLAIQACNALKKPLRIIGEGPEKKNLQSIAGPTITFAGFVEREKLRDEYAKARAVIFPGDEDFGLVPVEAMACGTPVIAYGSGGALETMIEGETGEFFKDPTSESLQQAIQKFEQKKYSSERMLEQAKKFSRQQFEVTLRQRIEGVLPSKS